jgi:hypothetical protein
MYGLAKCGVCGVDCSSKPLHHLHARASSFCSLLPISWLCLLCVSSSDSHSPRLVARRVHSPSDCPSKHWGAFYYREKCCRDCGRFVTLPKIFPVASAEERKRDGIERMVDSVVRWAYADIDDFVDNTFPGRGGVAGRPRTDAKQTPLISSAMT